MDVSTTIQDAELILPGSAAPEGQTDFRWQAIIKISEFIETEPQAVWGFVRKWGSSTDEDIRNAIATCLLEHLLEDHFSMIYPLVEVEARRNKLFVDTLRRCWNFGQAESKNNSHRLEALLNELK